MIVHCTPPSRARRYQVMRYVEGAPLAAARSKRSEHGFRLYRARIVRKSADYSVRVWDLLEGDERDMALDMSSRHGYDVAWIRESLGLQKRTERCVDCGQRGASSGHQECQYPR